MMSNPHVAAKCIGHQNCRSSASPLATFATCSATSIAAGTMIQRGTNRPSGYTANSIARLALVTATATRLNISVDAGSQTAIAPPTRSGDGGPGCEGRAPAGCSPCDQHSERPVDDLGDDDHREVHVVIIPQRRARRQWRAARHPLDERLGVRFAAMKPRRPRTPEGERGAPNW